MRKRKKCFNKPWTVSLADVLSRVPTIFWAMHWYRPSSSGRTSLMSKFPPSTIRIRATGLLFIWWMAFPPRFSSKSNTIPSFFHSNVISGIAFGGEHSSNAVSPAATRVSFGSMRKSSRKTVNKKIREKKSDMN